MRNISPRNIIGLLTLGGAFPFLLTFVLQYMDADFIPFTARGMVIYAALILSFVGAVHMGLVIAAMEGWQPANTATDDVFRARIDKKNWGGLRSMLWPQKDAPAEEIASDIAAMKQAFVPPSHNYLLLWSVLPMLLAWMVLWALGALNLQLAMLAILFYITLSNEQRNLHHLLPAWFYRLRFSTSIVVMVLLLMLSISNIANLG